MARADVVGVPAWRARRAFLAVVSFALAFGAVMLARGAMRGFGGPGGSDERSVVFAGIPMFTLAAPSIKAGVVDASRPAGQPPKSRTRVLESGADGAVIALPAIPGLVAGLIAALGLPIAAWAAVRFVAPTPAWVPAAGLWLGIGLPVLDVLAVFLTGTRIEVDRRALRVFHGMGGIGWTRTVPIGDIAAVKYDPAGTPEYGRVEAHLEDGKSYWVAANLAGLEESKWLATELTRAIERCRTRR
jgi:hypothetical protein